MKPREWWIDPDTGDAYEGLVDRRSCIHVREVLPDSVTITREQWNEFVRRRSWGVMPKVESRVIDVTDFEDEFFGEKK